MTAEDAFEYDPHNDRFVRDVVCPHPECGEKLRELPKSDEALYLCARCERPFEVVRLPMAASVGGASPWTARRARSAFCTRSGKKINHASVLDFAGAGGGPARGNSARDEAGALFGQPSRDVEWALERGWCQERWGLEDRARPEEQVTSLSVVRGVLVAVSAAGRVGLFNLADGTPLLPRPLELPNAGIDPHDPARAVRLPPAFLGGHMVALTDRVAIFRDLSASLFPGAAPSSDLMTVAPTPGAQWIGPPLFVGHRGDGVCVLVEGQPRGQSNPPEEVVARGFSARGEEIFALPLPGAVRPVCFDKAQSRVLTVNELGHLYSFAPERGAELHHLLPGAMLQLAITERPHLAVANNAAGDPELWLADDRAGDVRVWRADLRGESSELEWETLFEDDDLGQLRGFAVGHGGRDTRNLQGQFFVLSAEQATAAYPRSVRSAASDAVLPCTPITPPLLTSIGYFIQDRRACWLRGFAPWNWRDDNPVRRIEPVHPEVRAPFFDRTLAMYGREVFFATGGLITQTRAVKRDVKTS